MENIIAGILAVTGLAEIYILIYLVASPRYGRKKPLIRRLEKLNVFLALFFVLTLATFFLSNAQVFADNISFDLNGGVAATPSINDPIFAFPTSTPVNAGVAPVVPVPPTGTSMKLVIPKIGVNAPIIFPSDTTGPTVLKSLESGVGVYPGSILPGQQGRMILLGHSSRASWYHGNYAYVFSLLSKLKVGDEFMIVSGDTKYVYRVFASVQIKIVDEDAYLAQPPVGSELDLSTCWPSGTADARAVIKATLVTAG